MDNACWNPDADLVIIMESIPFIRYDTHHKAVEKWVKENNIKPQLSIGDKVSWKGCDGNKTGIISDIKLETGSYVIETNNKRYIVPFEDASSA